MTRRHTFSGPSSSVMKNYLPQSLSMPTDAQSRIMEVFKKLNLTSGVVSITYNLVKRNPQKNIFKQPDQMVVFRLHESGREFLNRIIYFLGC